MTHRFVPVACLPLATASQTRRRVLVHAAALAAAAAAPSVRARRPTMR